MKKIKEFFLKTAIKVTKFALIKLEQHPGKKDEKKILKLRTECDQYKKKLRELNET